MVMVFGEITTAAKVDYEAIVRKTCRDIGFTSEDVGLDADTCKVRPCSREQQGAPRQGAAATPPDRRKGGGGSWAGAARTAPVRSQPRLTRAPSPRLLPLFTGPGAHRGAVA